MNKETRQRSIVNRDTPTQGEGGDDTLSEKRSEIDRLLAVASRSFDSLTEGNSREFLRASEQTGGQ